MTIKKSLVSARRYKAGYEVRTEVWESGSSPGVIMRSAYTPKGEYIGSPRDGRTLVVKRGIKPQYARKDSRVCSIGFCERDQKWYGWSHRAIVGFGIGDMIFEERFGDDKTPFVRHGKRPIRTLKDAKLAAARFAASVS
jgi:hypothetical protein